MIASVAVPGRAAQQRSMLRLVLCSLVAIALAIGVVSWRLQDRGTRVTAAPGAKMPASATIEQNWGIRFVALSVLADGGLIELRYQVVDPAKSGRIHVGDAQSDTKNLPVLVEEGTGAKVQSRSVMFHFQHSGDVSGRLYSIIYGNAGGALKPHTLVTIRLSDGSELQHVPVTI
jgi:hypothetical protein